MTQARNLFETHPTEPDFNSILANIHGTIVWEADLWADRFFFVTESAVEMLGYSTHQWYVKPGFLRAHIHAEDWSGFLAVLYRAAIEGGAHAYQHRMTKRDGSILWAQTSLRRCDRANGTTSIAGSTVDITDLKNYEQTLHEDQIISKKLIQNIREYAVFMVSTDGKVASWNQGARWLKGYDVNEVIGTSFSHFFPPEEIGKGTPELLLKTAELEQHAQYEGWLLRKDHSVFWGKISMSSLTDEKGELQGFSNVAADLTEQKKAEQALQEREQHYRRLVDSVQDYAVFTLSVDGFVQSWNQGAQRLKGYRSNEIIGSNITQFFPSEELDKGVVSKLLKDASLNNIASYEGWLVRKGGETYWATMTLSAIEDEHGNLQGLSNVAKNLSSRKHFEDALLESEQRFRLLIQNLHDYAVFMISSQGLVEDWNPGAERIKGFKGKEIIGLPFWIFFPAEQVEKKTPERLLEQAAKLGRSEYEGWIVQKNGRRVWANIIFSAVQDNNGNLKGFSIVARDLTDRMMTERSQAFLARVSTELAESLDYRAILTRTAQLAVGEISDICFVHSKEGKEEIKLLTFAQSKQENQDFLNHLNELMLSRLQYHFGPGAVIRTGRPELSESLKDLSVYQPDQSERLLAILTDLGLTSYMSVPIQLHGETLASITFCSTESNRRYGSEDLELAMKVADRAALAIENSQLYNKVQKAVELREQVLAIVSHDLKNPLNAIQLSASQLSKIPEGHPEQIRMFASNIINSSERMIHLIRDLLDFSSIEAGKLRLDFKTQDVNSLLQEVIANHEQLAAQKGILLQLELPPTPMQVRCDPQRITQVLTNLIDNAIKATHREGRVLVRAQRDPRRAILSVSDTGGGISEEDQRHIFDRYWQGKKEGRVNIGLGLAISKAIIESHEGTIWVRSELGQGSTFFFCLPIKL